MFLTRDDAFVDLRVLQSRYRRSRIPEPQHLGMLLVTPEGQGPPPICRSSMASVAGAAMASEAKRAMAENFILKADLLRLVACLSRRRADGDEESKLYPT